MVFAGAGVLFGATDIICSGHFFMYHGAAPVGVLIMFSGHFLIYHGFAPVAVLIIGTVLCIGVVFLVVVSGDFNFLGAVGMLATDHVPTDALFFTGLIATGLNPQKEVPKPPFAPPPPKLPPQKFIAMNII